MNFNDQGIFGFDISFYQNSPKTPQGIDFEKMKDYGARFVVVKCGQKNYSDPDFQYNWEKSAKAGLPRASYWFCDKYDTGKNQAIKFWNSIKSDQPEGFLAADYENGSWTDWNELYNFLSELQQISGYPSDRLFIYTGYYFWASHAPKDYRLEWFKQFPLWEAWYGKNPRYVRIPKPWSDLTLWQDGTPSIGNLVGVESKEIDHNKLNGGEDVFEKIFRTTKPPIPPVDTKSKRITIDIHSDATYTITEE